VKFAFLGFSEVRAQNPVFSSPYSGTSVNGDSRKFALDILLRYVCRNAWQTVVL
jgi:hypothetical protein